MRRNRSITIGICADLSVRHCCVADIWLSAVWAFLQFASQGLTRVLCRTASLDLLCRWNIGKLGPSPENRFPPVVQFENLFPKINNIIIVPLSADWGWDRRANIYQWVDLSIMKSWYPSLRTSRRSTTTSTSYGALLRIHWLEVRQALRLAVPPEKIRNSRERDRKRSEKNLILRSSWIWSALLSD